MHGRHSAQIDVLGLDTPFSEHIDESPSPYTAPLNFGEDSYVIEPPGETPARAGLSWLEDVQFAETAAAEASAAEWLEAEWLETPAHAGEETPEAFAERLGAEWSRRRKGDPTPTAMAAWLRQDHADTQTGARKRWGKRATPEFLARVSRAWMTSREQQMRFKTEAASLPSLSAFAPPAAHVDLVTDAIISGSDVAPVAPLTLRFARALKSRYPGVKLTNYRGHGGGAFLNRGYSLDLFISGKDDRGFYPPQDVIRLLRAVDAAARAVRVQWRALYNDFTVADAINREMRRTQVFFIGAAGRNKAKQVNGLLWHGPDPLILHVHLDLSPLAGTPLGEAEEISETYEEENEAPLCHCGPHAASHLHERCEYCGGRGQEAPEGWGSETEELDASGMRSRYDESESGFEGFTGETVLQEREDSVLANAGLSPAEFKALMITSTLETGRAGGFFGLSGNFDGQGLSYGLVNWTIGTGSLQPLLRTFAREQPSRWAAIFGPDAVRFLQLILPNTAAALKAQLAFAVNEMNAVTVLRGRKRWAIRKPWSDYFLRLSEDAEFRKVQVRFVRDLLSRAAYFCRLFNLKSEAAFAFMFDAVSSHGKWWLTKKFGTLEKRRLMIEEKLRPLTSGGAQPPERDVLLIIADVLGATSAARWAEKVRVRKRWFVTGEHPRARELAKLRPRLDTPWTSSAPPAQEAEGLSWLDFEGVADQAFDSEIEPSRDPVQEIGWGEQDLNNSESEHESDESLDLSAHDESPMSELESGLPGEGAEGEAIDLAPHPLSHKKAKNRFRVSITGFNAGETDLAKLLERRPGTAQAKELTWLVDAVYEAEHDNPSGAKHCALLFYGTADRDDTPGRSPAARVKTESERSFARSGSAMSWLLAALNKKASRTGKPSIADWSSARHVSAFGVGVGASTLDHPPASPAERALNRRVTIVVHGYRVTAVSSHQNETPVLT